MAPASAPPVADRAWFLSCFRTLAAGWYRALIATSPSCAVWQPPQGIVLPNFISASGQQCDGVTRWMPALAAYAAQPANPPIIVFDDGLQMDVRKTLRDAFVHATDPAHPDFWQYPRQDIGNQRQVEASIVAWSLWLSRDWLFRELTAAQIAHLQAWLAACTVFTDHFNNWALFTATNHAARISLADHGFHGDPEATRRDLIPGDEVYLADGWMWDGKYHGIDYYNFWVNGSHHCYLRKMLPDFPNAMLDRALEQFQVRMRDLPYLIDAAGRNVLFGRSLSYRWGWLSGLIAAHDLGIATVDAALTRAMLARNLQAWLEADSLDEGGVLRERLTGAGSDGARSNYINCGHPYWGMQCFLCLQFAPDHPFWRGTPPALPCETEAFQVPRQGPGLVFQSLHAGRDVRLYNLRNLNSHHGALYQKFVYTTAFPCNAGDHHATLGDNQLVLRWSDGSIQTAQEILEVDVNDGRRLHLVWNFKAPPAAPDQKPFRATVHTTLTVAGDGYDSEHRIVTAGPLPAGACWVEGGFALSLPAGATPEIALQALHGRAALGDRTVDTAGLAGWDSLHLSTDGVEQSGLFACPAPPNIVTGHSRHFLLSAPAVAAAFDAPQVLYARHRATVA